MAYSTVAVAAAEALTFQIVHFLHFHLLYILVIYLMHCITW